MSIPPSIKPHFPQKQPVIIQNVSPHQNRDHSKDTNLQLQDELVLEV